MIKEDFVSFETAKLLKEKGFDIPLLTFYITDKEKKEGELQTMAFTDDKINNDHSDICYLAPTLQMAMKWMREVHKLYVEVYIVKNYNNKTVEYCITIEDLNFPSSDDGFDIGPSHKSYEEAAEAAIKYCLENLI